MKTKRLRHIIEFFGRASLLIIMSMIGKVAIGKVSLTGNIIEGGAAYSAPNLSGFIIPITSYIIGAFLFIWAVIPIYDLYKEVKKK